ncbi:MAG: diguanylate cyclase [Candidatus Omnitrophica bacterium]|nr:diguanylate cyclase [Candidatus Omnitrophota bacterium]
MDYFLQFLKTFSKPLPFTGLALFPVLFWAFYLKLRLNSKNAQIAQLNKRLARSSFIDTITDLYNSKYLAFRLKESLTQAERHNFSVSLLKIDIELFKNINKIYGVSRGDVILREFACFLKNELRTGDILARSKEDEFIVICSYTSKEEATRLAGRIQEKLKFRYFGKEKISLQISIGLVTYPEDGTNEEILLSILNQCLNCSKAKNNKVITLRKLKENTAASEDNANGKHEVTELKNKILQLTTMLDRTTLETIIAFATAIKAKDFYTAEHTERTVTIALVIGRKLNLEEQQLEIIRYAAMLHDLGKVGIPESILQKPGELTAEEFKKIKKHPVIGAEILRPLHPLIKIIPSILYHHERIDGHGYPYGLKNNQIPIEAKVVALADSFQALVSDRPYRKAYEFKKALKIISRESGSHFDPEVVKAFTRSISLP